MKKRMVVVAVVAVAAVAAWNFSQSSQVVSTSSDLTLENLEAIAQGRGTFPACQKTELTIGEEPRVLPFCVNGKCEKVVQIPYGLDVNSCSEDPHPLSVNE